MSEIQAFVGASHGDIDAVRTALDADPTLANAAWDWGDGAGSVGGEAADTRQQTGRLRRPGDWESALGAAGHMGRRDIAELLLAHGARLDIFVAAMLDEVEIVQALLPFQHDARGPHGIPLRAHAEAGKAERVLEFLGRG